MENIQRLKESFGASDVIAGSWSRLPPRGRRRRYHGYELRDRNRTGDSWTACRGDGGLQQAGREQVESDQRDQPGTDPRERDVPLGGFDL